MAIVKQYHKDTQTTYVYESESYYVPELGQSRSRRKCIGKIDPVTNEIVPCGKRGRKKKQPDNPSAQVNAEEYQKLQKDYGLLKTEATQLRVRFTETEKELLNLRQQNQKMAETLQKIQKLLAED